MFKKLFFGNGVKHSEGYIVRRGTYASIRYSDHFVEAEVQCDYIYIPDDRVGLGFFQELLRKINPKRWVGVVILPETLKVMKKGEYIKVSNEAAKIIHQRIDEGMTHLGIKVEVKSGKAS